MSESGNQELLPNERDIIAKLGDEAIDMASMSAISNIYRAAAAVRRRAEGSVLAEAGLSWGGFTTMFVLYVWDEMETGHLAAECDLSKGTLTGILNTLEKRELVARRRPDADRRRMLVHLTPTGGDLMTSLVPRFNAFEVESASALDDAERRQLSMLLRKIITSIADAD